MAIPTAPIARYQKDKFFRFPADRELTETELRKFIAKNDRLFERKFKKLIDAYEGRYDIFKQAPKPKFKPDNRVAIDFAGTVTDTFEGFFMGTPPTFSSDDENVQAYITHLHSYIGVDDHNAELSNAVSIYGRAYEIYFVDTYGDIDTAVLSPIDGFMIYDEGIDADPLYFVRTYYDYDNIRRGSIADEQFVRYFHFEGGFHWDDEPQPHGFARVPATEYIQNDSRKGIFEGALSAINEYNKALSEKGNDVDAFADAYLKILGADIDKKTLTWMRDNRIINLKQTMDGRPVDVGFLTKPNADTTQEHLIDRLERGIFITSKVINLFDEKVQTASGEALRQRMTPMIALAGTKSRKMDNGFKRRYMMIFSNPCSGMDPDAWTEVTWKYHLALPDTLKDEAETAGKLAGIVSRRKQLSTLSIVDDVDKEIEEIEKENSLPYTDGYEISRTPAADSSDDAGDGDD